VAAAGLAGLIYTPMLILVAILILLIAVLVMLSIRLLRPGFAFHWLAAAGSTLTAWTLCLLARSNLPATVNLGSWQPTELFPSSPTLLIDNISWPFALALASLALASILTDTVRTTYRPKISVEENSITQDVKKELPSPGWADWAGILGITVAGILAVLAGNLLTLLLLWAAIDLLEVIVRVSRASKIAQSEAAVIVYFAGLAGIFIAWMGLAGQTFTNQEFASLSPTLAGYIILAVGVRMAVLPVRSPLPRTISHGQSLESILRLASPAASLVVLSRCAAVGVAPTLVPYLLGLVGFAAIYHSLNFTSAASGFDAQKYWASAMAALSIASAVLGLPEVCQAWSIGALFSGGALSLYSERNRWLSILPMLGALGFCTLPFTPGWSGVGLFSAAPLPAAAAFLVAHGVLLGGYCRHALRSSRPVVERAERWVRLIYPWGLAILPFTQLIAYWWGAKQQNPTWFQSMFSAGSIFLAFGVVLVGLLKVQRGIHVWRRINSILSLDWFYRIVWRLYRMLSRYILSTNKILEGPAGLLWAFLLLGLMISVLAQVRGGG
jgi:hypothetical protein